MSDMVIQMDLMIESLKKKKRLLEEIDGYTKKQADLLSQADLDLKSFNNIMKNKQVRIDKLIQLDEGFAALYERIKTTLKNQPEIYKEAVLTMQQLIKDTTDLGVKIQVQEERNKVNFEQKSKGYKGEVKAFRNHKNAMAKYQKSYNTQQKADDPHFFDSKK